MRRALALLACALIGCGSLGAAADRFGNSTADQFQTACMRSGASSPKGAAILKKLCSCTSKKIRSSVRTGDSQDIVESKIETARRACLRKVYPNGI